MQQGVNDERDLDVAMPGLATGLNAGDKPYDWNDRPTTDQPRPHPMFGLLDQQRWAVAERDPFAVHAVDADALLVHEPQRPNGIGE